MSDQQPSREISKTIGGMSMITLIHMAVDLMVAAALFFMMKKRTSHLQAQIDKLTERVTEQDNMLRQHHAILSQLLNGGAPLPPMRQPMPSQQEQTPMREPERQRQPVQRTPAREQQSPSPKPQQPQQPPVVPQKPTQRKQPIITSDTEYTEGEPDESTLDAIINDEFENERDLNCDDEQCTIVEKKNIIDADNQ